MLAKTQLEHAPDLQGKCLELETAIKGRYRDLLAGAVVMVNRRCPWMKLAARQEQAELIVQEAVVRAWEHRNQFDPTRQAVAWIMGFICKVALEKLARPSKHVNHTDLGDETWIAAMTSLTAPVTTNDNFELLELARQKLSPDQQRVLKLAFEESLDGAELAGRLGLTPGTARVAKSRALKALRDAYKQLDGNGGREP